MAGEQSKRLDWYYKKFGHVESYLSYPKGWANNVKIDVDKNLVAEPTVITNDDIKDLARIADLGFDISITPKSEYYPNVTLKIVIKP